VHPYDPVLVTEWGDGEHRFRLRVKELLELESKCDAGIYAVFRRLAAGAWYVNDVRETVRLGLIGSDDCKPAEAAKLVKQYCDERPLVESLETALLILNKTLTPPDDIVKKKPDDPGAENLTG
jgi:hypothetical protein